MWMVGLAWATPEVPEVAPPGDMDEVSAEVEPAQVEPPSQRALLEEAVALRRVGAFDEAAAMLAEARTTGGDVDEQVAYQSGVLLEVTEQWAKAAIAYEAVEAGWPDTSSAVDACFRRAYCLEETGDHKASIRVVRGLQRRGHWSPSDEASMSLQRGIAETRAGRVRRGIRRILKALESGSMDRNWIQAKARLALVRAQTEAAEGLVLKGNRKAARRLKRRSALIASAEKQAIAMFNLGEPEFALEGLLLLGDAYLALYEDMLEYPPPRSVPKDQRGAYREAVAKKAQILRAKAHARYDEGVRVAARTQWVGSVTQRLVEARDRVTQAPPSTP
jgi:tetratricopeptide (TPR) repeat protein